MGKYLPVFGYHAATPQGSQIVPSAREGKAKGNE